MEDLSVQVLIFLVVMAFIASFIDSVVGGGGLIMIPSLLFLGISPVYAFGINKFASTFGTCTSMISFLRSGKVNKKLVTFLFPISFIGSAIGAYVVTLIPADFLRPLVIVLLVLVTIYTLMKKDWGSLTTFQKLTKKTGILVVLMAASMGFYDGFFGPGTGSFYLFCFLLLGFNFVESAGNAKVLNFASNISAMMMFIYLDAVLYQYAIPMAASMMLGAMCGSQMAIRKGASYVRILFVSITVVLISKQIWDLLHSS